MRIMGLDFGSKTVGVAVSDELFITAQGVETIFREREDKLRKTLSRICELAESYDVGKIVVGLPLNMDDSVGERARKTMEFADMLKKRVNVEVIFQDERLSTFEAKETLREMGVKEKDMKKYVDKVAATYILQDFLNGQ